MDGIAGRLDGGFLQSHPVQITLIKVTLSKSKTLSNLC